MSMFPSGPPTPLYRGRRPHRSLGIVLLRHGVAEQRHQPVAELRAVKSFGSVPAAHRFSRATESATVAKPSTNFTDSLPSLFGLLSDLRFKTVAGPHIGETKF
jgi:hypothetical protein